MYLYTDMQIYIQMCTHTKEHTESQMIFIILLDILKSKYFSVKLTSISSQMNQILIIIRKSRKQKIFYTNLPQTKHS